jgi:hypothetical protein
VLVPENPATHAELWALQAKYERFARVTLRIITFLVLAQLIGAGLNVFLLREDHARSTENAAAILAVQDSRVQSIVIQCQQQNSNHNAAVRKLPVVFPRLPAKAIGPVADIVAPYTSDCLGHAKQLAQAQTPSKQRKAP